MASAVDVEYVTFHDAMAALASAGPAFAALQPSRDLAVRLSALQKLMLQGLYSSVRLSAPSTEEDLAWAALGEMSRGAAQRLFIDAAAAHLKHVFSSDAHQRLLLNDTTPVFLRATLERVRAAVLCRDDPLGMSFEVMAVDDDKYSFDQTKSARAQPLAVAPFKSSELEELRATVAELSRSLQVNNAYIATNWVVMAGFATGILYLFLIR